MLAERPKISVCIPTHNRARYLREALRSVLGQSEAGFEVVVFDDASTDGTRQVVGDLGDPRVRYYRHERRVGVAANRNSCLLVARGQYVAWLDSDDTYAPDMLSRQSAVLDRHPNVGLVHGGHQVIDADGRRLPDWPTPFDRDTIESGRQALDELLLTNYVAAPTVLVRRELHDHVGPYRTDLGASSTDWDMWLRMAVHANLAYTASTVAHYRYHQHSISGETAQSGERLRCDLSILDRFFARYRTYLPDASDLERRARAALAARALRMADEAFTRGEPRHALRALRFSTRVAPWLRRDWRLWLVASAVVRRNEFAAYHYSKQLLHRLYQPLAQTRFGAELRKVAVVDTQWEHTLRQIARVIRQIVPTSARVAAVDKCDPTLLHLSRRRGWHFPDRRLAPDGYPPDSATAIAHLEQLRAWGAEYLVIPAAAFWWLEFYDGLCSHLKLYYQRVWIDDRCMLYRLT